MILQLNRHQNAEYVWRRRFAELAGPEAVTFRRKKNYGTAGETLS